MDDRLVVDSTAARCQYGHDEKVKPSQQPMLELIGLLPQHLTPRAGKNQGEAFMLRA